MSDIVRLNIKSKGIKAVFSDHGGLSEAFTELPEVLEREKQEHTHKLELENEFKKGYENGVEETRDELERKHSQELLEQSQDFYNIISNFEERFKNFENDFHKLVTKVSYKVAEKILQKELQENSIIEQILDENISKLFGANDIIIKLNQKDHELIKKSSKEYLASNGITKLRFEANDKIQVGGCLIESNIGNLDARIDSQISEIIRTIEDKMIGQNIV
jgi:flagellar assembly protein FliH